MGKCSWTLSKGDTFLYEKSSFWVNFRGLRWYTWKLHNLKTPCLQSCRTVGVQPSAAWQSVRSLRASDKAHCTKTLEQHFGSGTLLLLKVYFAWQYWVLGLPGLPACPEIRQSTIWYTGLLGRRDKRLIDQVSNVPSIIFYHNFW